ncbi:hypothetical protein ACN2WE_19565 [Streptomyces sp. cg28]|uniref:hypothetical protein n=1 Tax=Streptomyces sp. cg28 TaxID=3403457 RepID=UPI003B216400
MSRRTTGPQDLIVFLAVLAAGTALVLLGVAPESLAAVAVTVSGLYAAWRGHATPPPPPPSPSSAPESEETGRPSGSNSPG